MEDAGSSAPSRGRKLEDVLQHVSFHGSEVSVSISDPNLRDCPMVAVSESFQKMTGYQRFAAIGQNCRILNEGCYMEPHIRTALRHATTSGSTFAGTVMNKRSNGEMFLNFLSISSEVIGDRKYLLGIQIDVSNCCVDLESPGAREELRQIHNGIVSANLEEWMQEQRNSVEESLRSIHAEHDNQHKTSGKHKGLNILKSEVMWADDEEYFATLKEGKKKGSGFVLLSKQQRTFLKGVIEGLKAQMAVTLIIMLDVILSIVAFFIPPSAAMDIINIVVVLLLTVELLFRMVVYGQRFFLKVTGKVEWLNIFEVIVIALCLVFTFTQNDMPISLARAARPVFRVFRAGRVIRQQKRLIMGAKSTAEAHVRKLFDKHIGDIFYILPENIVLDLDNGLLRIEKAHINSEVLGGLHLPFDVKGGIVEHVHIQIPLRHFEKEKKKGAKDRGISFDEEAEETLNRGLEHLAAARMSLTGEHVESNKKNEHLIQVEIRNILLVLGPSIFDFDDTESVLKRKAKLVDLVVRHWLPEGKGLEDNERQRKSYMNRRKNEVKELLRERILDSIAVQVRNVAIRYEDPGDVGIVLNPFACGIKLGSLTITSAVSARKLRCAGAWQTHANSGGRHAAMVSRNSHEGITSSSLSSHDNRKFLACELHRFSIYWDIDPKTYFTHLFQCTTQREVHRRFVLSDSLEKFKLSALHSLLSVNIKSSNPRFRELFDHHRYVIIPISVSAHIVIQTEAVHNPNVDVNIVVDPIQISLDNRQVNNLNLVADYWRKWFTREHLLHTRPELSVMDIKTKRDKLSGEERLAYIKEWWIHAMHGMYMWKNYPQLKAGFWVLHHLQLKRAKWRIEYVSALLHLDNPGEPLLNIEEIKDKRISIMDIKLDKIHRRMAEIALRLPIWDVLKFHLEARTLYVEAYQSEKEVHVTPEGVTIVVEDSQVPPPDPSPPSNTGEQPFQATQGHPSTSSSSTSAPASAPPPSNLGLGQLGEIQRTQQWALAIPFVDATFFVVDEWTQPLGLTTPTSHIRTPRSLSSSEGAGTPDSKKASPGKDSPRKATIGGFGFERFVYKKCKYGFEPVRLPDGVSARRLGPDTVPFTPCKRMMLCDAKLSRIQGWLHQGSGLWKNAGLGVEVTAKSVKVRTKDLHSDFYQEAIQCFPFSHRQQDLMFVLEVCRITGDGGDKTPHETPRQNAQRPASSSSAPPEASPRQNAAEKKEQLVSWSGTVRLAKADLVLYKPHMAQLASHIYDTTSSTSMGSAWWLGSPLDRLKQPSAQKRNSSETEAHYTSSIHERQHTRLKKKNQKQFESITKHVSPWLQFHLDLAMDEINIQLIDVFQVMSIWGTTLRSKKLIQTYSVPPLRPSISLMGTPPRLSVNLDWPPGCPRSPTLPSALNFLRRTMPPWMSCRGAFGEEDVEDGRGPACTYKLSIQDADKSHSQSSGLQKKPPLAAGVMNDLQFGDEIKPYQMPVRIDPTIEIWELVDAEEGSPRKPAGSTLKTSSRCSPGGGCCQRVGCSF